MSKTAKTGYEPLTSIDAITTGLGSVGYISTRRISTALYLAHNLTKPVLIEGPAGVGKTDLRCFSSPLARCAVDPPAML